MAAIGANWQEVWVSSVWSAVWTQTPAVPPVVTTPDQVPAAKYYLLLRKRKRIKKRQELKNGS